MSIKITIDNDKQYKITSDNKRFSVIGIGKLVLRVIGKYLNIISTRLGFRYSLPIKFIALTGGAELPVFLPGNLN